MAPLKKKETLLKENHPFWEKPLFEKKLCFQENLFVEKKNHI